MEAPPQGDAFWFVVPWESYRRHGDRRALEATYPLMQKYLDAWIPRWTDKDKDPFAHTLTAGLGDWVAPRGVPTINALSSTAYFAHMAWIAAGVARALGRPADAARYDTLFARIRTDFNARFIGSDGFYREREHEAFVQTAQILPLAFGLVPDGRRAALAARLAADIASRGGNAYVGVLGARHVLPVLTGAGQHDAAVAVATETDEPGWGYWTDVAGFTALGEHWPADTRSRNHHMFGSIVQWFYEDLAGIRPVEPGYRLLEVRPAVPARGLDRVAASYDSVRGRIMSHWRRSASGLELDVVIPPNARARVFVPGRSPDAVSEVSTGRSILAGSAEGVTMLRVDSEHVVYEVGSGRYQFRRRE